MDGNNNTFAQAAANDSGLHLDPAGEAGLTEEQIANPQSGREYYLDSLAAILQENIGQLVTCEFLIGTNNIVRRDGILYSAGVNFLALYQPNEGKYVVCDVFSLRFITFYDTVNSGRASPRNAGNMQRSPSLQNGANMMRGSIPGGTSAPPIMGSQMPGMSGHMPRGTCGGY